MVVTTIIPDSTYALIKRVHDAQCDDHTCKAFTGTKEENVTDWAHHVLGSVLALVDENVAHEFMEINQPLEPN